MRFFLLILIPILIHAKELETCYRVYFWFFPVAESCVLYSKKGEELKIKSWAKTVVVGRIAKPVNSWGEATLFRLRPKSFSLYQREGSLIRDHLYLFGEKGVEYRIVKYKERKKSVKEGFFKSSVYLFDPFSTSLLVYLDTPNFKGGTIMIFYDGKVQSVDYRTIGEEKVDVMKRVYYTWKVLLVPKIDTKGMLKPKGKWYIWVDKETSIPVMLRVGFTIGNASIYLRDLRGDRNLIKEVKYEQANLF